MTESYALQALRTALEALRTAEHACASVGYGSQVMGSLSDAFKASQYALDTVEGRT